MQIGYSKVLSQPKSEPISLDEAKIHLRVDHGDEDELINILIQAAIELAEIHTNRSFITQTRQMKLDSFPAYYGRSGYNGCIGTIYLQNSPLISLSGVDADNNALGITYYDQNEALQTLSTSDYWVDSSSGIPRLVVKNSWPSTFTMPNAVIITYTAGYGAATAVPAQIKQALFLMIGHLYEHRESVSTEQLYEIPMGAKMLLGSYVVEQSVLY